MNKVKFGILHDDQTGLVILKFEWYDGDKIQVICEIGNRLSGGSSLPVAALAWDDEIDGQRAESRRAMIEAEI